MFRTSICLIVFTTLAFSVIAQEPPATPRETPDALNFKTLDAEFNERWRAWRSEKAAAQNREASKDELAKLDKAEPTGAYIPRFQAGAKRHAGTDAAIDYLSWLLSWGWRHEKKLGLDALAQLLRDHVAHPRMERTAFSLALKARRSGFPLKRALEAQDAFAAHAGTMQSRTTILFWRAYTVVGTNPDQESRARASKDLETVIKNGDATFKARAENLLFELNRLQIGMLAPDIEGKDLDGIAFKLSDYRGKVVFLDFWGDW